MKTNILIFLTCATLSCPAVADETWDMTRNLPFNQPSHTYVWNLPDGSKTYGSVYSDRTILDHRSTESVMQEAQFKQGLAVLAAAAVCVGVKALCDWLSTFQQGTFTTGASR